VAVGPSRLARGLSRALIVGASGQVGGALYRLVPNAVGTFRTRAQPELRHLEARDPDALRALLDETGARTLFFPAAQPSVDWCESHPSEAERENLDPLGVALAVARECSAFVVTYSSDYVFDGERGPYSEEDPVSPISVYGRIKVRVEELALEAGAAVVRSTGVFGYETGAPRNFVLRLVAALERGETVRVPSDQVSTPTYSDDLAGASALIAEARIGGIWHVAGPDVITRLELAHRAAAVFGLPPDLIQGALTAELDQIAPRPLRAGLRCEKLYQSFGFSVRSVDAALGDLRGRLDKAVT
jgi:dTDP-4-dehydrorhamnose reductase